LRWRTAGSNRNKLLTTSIVLSAGSLILSGFTFVFFLAYLKRRTGRDRILAELLSDLREEAAKIEREINAATDRDITLIEDRVKTLRTLLEDTDRRIAVYVRELERRQDQEEAFAALGREPAAVVNAAVPLRGSGAYTGNRRPPPAENPVYLPSGLFNSDVTPQNTVGSPPVEAASPPPEPAVGLAGGNAKRIVRSSTPVAPKPLPFAERVAELYRAGFSSNLIASRLGSTVTEVELAIALVERRNT
jgi:hypothetical protein